MNGLISYGNGIHAVDAHYLRPRFAAVHVIEEGGRIALVASGEFTLEGDDGAFPLRSGEAVFIPADEQVFAQGNGQLFITASGA